MSTPAVTLVPTTCVLVITTAWEDMERGGQQQLLATLQLAMGQPTDTLGESDIELWCSS